MHYNVKNFFDKQTNNNELICISNIEQVLSKFTDETNELKYSIINFIQEQQLYDQSVFKSYYQKFEEIEFVYDTFKNPICIKELYKDDYELKNEESISKFNTTKNFYEGFGQDILF